MTTLIPRSAFPMLSTDRIFNVMDDFFSNAWMPRENLIQNSFRMDIKESDENYTIEAELPGISKEEITLLMEDNKLKISVEKHEETKEEESNYLYRERRHSAMYRNVYLAEASGEGIEASLNDGVLFVTVPKKQKDEAQKIEIK